MRYVKLTILLCGLVWLCCSSTHLFASQGVSSGYICCFEPSNLYATAAFELSGVDLSTGVRFDVTGSFEDPTGTSAFAGNCPQCLPGTLLTVSGSTGGENFNGGTARIGTNYYPNVAWYNGLNQFAGYSEFTVSGPPILLTGPGIFKGTFSLIAPSFLCGFLSQDDMSCDISLPSLTGSGIVTVEVASIVGSPYIYVTEAGYTFTPEPTSLLLFGSGALGLASILRRKLTQ